MKIKGELYEMVLPLIKSTYDEYDYAEIPFEYYKEVSKKIIARLQKNLTDEKFINFNDMFLDELINFIHIHIHNLFKDSFEFQKIMTNFICKNIMEPESYNQALNELTEILIFFNDVTFFPTKKAIGDLIKSNKTLSKILEIIITNNMEIVIANKSHTIFENQRAVRFIEAYCELNHILIDKSDDFEFYNKFMTDFVEVEYVADSEVTYRNETNKPLLSLEEEQTLGYLILRGDEKAKQILIERNLRLVGRIALNYVGRGVPLLDLIQEGNIALIRSAEEFDVTQGCKFSTYALPSITRRITHALQKNSRIVSLTYDANEQIVKFRKVENILKNKLNRMPTIKEIAQELKMTIEETIEIYNLQLAPISLNKLAQDEGSSEIGDFMVSSDENLEDIVIASQSRIEVRELLEKCELTENEKKVLILHYGMYGNSEHRLSEIARILNLSSTRISQIKESALKKIRKSEHIGHLAIYTDNEERSMERIKQYNFSHKHKQSFNVDLSLIASQMQVQIDVRRLLEKCELTEREKQVLRLFGMYGHSEHFSDEIERIKESALRKIRELAYIEYLAVSTDDEQEAMKKFKQYTLSAKHHQSSGYSLST